MDVPVHLGLLPGIEDADLLDLDGDVHLERLDGRAVCELEDVLERHVEDGGGGR